MIARILDPEEWQMLDGPQIAQSIPFVSPQNIAVVVVEDELGKIVACMSVLLATHFEGLWIDPEQRGNAGVTRALLNLATALAQARGEQWVFGGAADDKMRGFIDRLGGKQIPMELYALAVGGE